MHEMMSMNKFKQTILNEGFNFKRKYKLKSIKLNKEYFNDREDLYLLCKDILKSYSCKENGIKCIDSNEFFAKGCIKEIASLLYTAYDKDLTIFINKGTIDLVYDSYWLVKYLGINNCLLLFKKFCGDIINIGGEREIRGITNDRFPFFKFCNHTFKLDKDAFKNIVNEHILKKMIEDIHDGIDGEEYNEFFDFLIDNFDIRDYIEKNRCLNTRKQLYGKVIDAGQSFNKKDEYNLDVLLRYAFVERDEKMVEFLCSKLSSISTDKIDRKLIEKAVYVGHKNKVSFDYIPFKIIQYLSQLENFEDFVQNNRFILMKILDEEGMQFIENYVQTPTPVIQPLKEIRTMDDFKQVILSEGFDFNRIYKINVKKLNKEYFNNHECLYDLYKEEILEYYCHGKNGKKKLNKNKVFKKKCVREIASLLYIAYDKDLSIFMDGKNRKIADYIHDISNILSVNNIILLIKEISNPKFSKNKDQNGYTFFYCTFSFITLCNRAFKLGVNLDKLINETSLEKIFDNLHEYKECDEFFNYLFDNFDVKKFVYSKIRYNNDIEKIKYFTGKLIDREIHLNDKIKYNMDILLFFAFDRGNEDAVEYLSNVLSSISTDKICDSILRKRRNSFGGYDESEEEDKVTLNIIQHLSHLENFEDFVKNNEYVLSQILDEEAKQFIENYI